jgi:serine/threonine protein kinase
MFTDRVGTDAYQAPEIKRVSPDSPYSGSKADVFSAGITLFAMSRGFPPFTKASKSDRFFNAIE